MTKEQLRDRLEEILDVYLMDERETYCQIDLYFERGSECQMKRLTFGRPQSGNAHITEDEEAFIKVLSETGILH